MASINSVVHIKCRDLLYPVRVCEEQVVVATTIGDACNCASYQIKVDQWSNNGMVNQCSSVGGYSRKDEAEVAVVAQKEVAIEAEVANTQPIQLAANKTDRSISLLQDCSVLVVEETGQVGLGRQNVVHACNVNILEILKDYLPINEKGELVAYTEGTNGLMESLSVDGLQNQGINLAVVLSGVQMDREPVRPYGNVMGQVGLGLNNDDPQIQGCRTVSLSSMGCGSPAIQPTFKLRKQNGDKGKRLQNISGSIRKGGSPSKSRLVDQRMKDKGGRRIRQGGPVVMGSWSRVAVFRAIAGTSARSTSSGNGKCNGKSAQKEVEATVLLGKALGICFEGKEEEVIKKLVSMEIVDKEQVAHRTVKVHKEAVVQD
ncbi:hypothetical protein CsSME_00019025 [Camellia sinensis var. sinensis]